MVGGQFRGAGRKGVALSFAFLFMLCLEAFAFPAIAADSAVAVMYHRFGDGRYPSTNIRLEQFGAHLAELKSGPYTVLPLTEILDRLESGGELPERTVAITIDDAFLSVYREAWPRLRDTGLPFTLFVSTDPVDQGNADYMNWDQIREMAAGGATIGHHGAAHDSFAKIGAERAQADIERANARYLAELGRVPEILAYPYGEASSAVEDVVREMGFKAAFGQHSGAFWPGADRFYLPRFPLNETYGDEKRFSMAANALPLPVTDLTPADPTLVGENPPAIGFTVDGAVKGLGALGCFASHEGKVEILRLGERRIEVRPTEAFPPGRSRLNCTMPAGNGRWRWFGMQYWVPGR